MAELPPRLDLEQLGSRAQELYRAAADGDPDAAARVAAASPDLTLASAQHAIALEDGFPTWARLTREVERREILDRRDVTRLSALLAAEPELATDADGALVRPSERRVAARLHRNAAIRHHARGVAGRSGKRRGGTPAARRGGARRRRARGAGDATDHRGELRRCGRRSRPRRGRRRPRGAGGGRLGRRPGRHGTPPRRRVRHDGRGQRARRCRRAGQRHRGGGRRRRHPWLARRCCRRHSGAGARDGGGPRASRRDRRAGRVRHPVDASDPVFGGHPLRTAAANGRPASVRRLLAHGADPGLRDEQGRTPLDLCRAGTTPGHREVEAILALVTDAL